MNPPTRRPWPTTNEILRGTRGVAPDLSTVRKVPVALVMFNRPDRTKRVFDRIAEYRPETLLLIADGPRFPEEHEACQNARAVARYVDWDCDVLTDFSDTNLGLKRRVVSGFDWVFRLFDEAILLEDDTLPSRSFFAYCAELLDRFRDDPRLMMVGGNNHSTVGPHPTCSYFFSKYWGTGGWATWRRAWREYDEAMTAWPAMRDTTWLEDTIGNVTSASSWRTEFDRASAGETPTWSYQWVFTMWQREAFSINPARNLVRNIGFGKAATNTVQRCKMSRFPAKELEFPLRHPSSVSWSADIDRGVFHGADRLWAEPSLRKLYVRLYRRGLGLGLRRRVPFLFSSRGHT